MAILLNRDVESRQISFDVSLAEISANNGYSMRQIWEEKDYESCNEEVQSFIVEPHGVIVLEISQDGQ